MSVETGFRLAVIGDASVSAVIGDRLYARALPQRPTYPAAAMQTISDVPAATLDGNVGRRVARVQVDVFAGAGAGEAAAVADAIRRAMDAYSGASGDSMITMCRLENERSEYDPEPRLFRVIQDWLVAYAPA